MDIKCRKCRKVLIAPENKIQAINAHHIEINESSSSRGPRSGRDQSCASVAQPTSLYIDPDLANNVDWIQQEIIESEWSKGKLKCPSCQVDVGSFSFLNSMPCQCGKFQLPSLQLIVSRVDVSKDLSLP